jgi:hypothetical protein
MSKRNSSSPHTWDSKSSGNAAIASVMLQHKLRRDSTLLLHKTSLMYIQKEKSMGIKSELHWGQLIDYPLMLHQPRNWSFKAVHTMALKYAGAPYCSKIKPSTSATVHGDTKFCSIFLDKLHSCVLMEEETPNNSVHDDAALHVDLGTVAILLQEGK